MAATMQQHRVACGDIGQILHQAVKVDAAGFGVEIAVFGHLHAKVFDDRGVVWPGWV